MSKRFWQGNETKFLKRNQRQAGTEEQAVLARERDRISKMNQRQAKTEEQAALAREKHRLAMKIQR